VKAAVILLLALIALVPAAAAEEDQDSIHELFVQGVDAYEKERNYDNALDLMNKVLEADPNYDGALYYRAKIYISRDKLDEATADIEHALEINPNEKRYLYTKGRIFQIQGDPEKAIEWYSKALDQGFYSLALQKRIRLYIDAGEYQKALDDCGWLYKHEPLPATVLLRAEAYLGLGQYDKVLEDCTWLLQQEPMPEAKMLRAKMYLKLGQLDKALADCNDVLTGGKKKEDLTTAERERTAANFMVRAQVYLKLGETEKAYYDLVSASYLETKKPEPLLALGDFFLFDKPDFRQAIAYYTAVIELDDFKEPRSEPEKKRHEPPIARLRRGQAYVALDPVRFAKNALADFARYIELQPDDPRGYAERAKFYSSKGERDKALADIRKALELDPDNEQYAQMFEAITQGSAEARSPGGSTDTEPPDSEEE
jgi:tetratricopeptide (TPR) repeat protein